jgi:hypothetical protein
LSAEEDAKISGSEVARDKFFRGTLRQDEFHRRLNEVNTEKGTLAEQRRALEEEAAKVVDWYKSEAPKNEVLLKTKANLEAQLAAYQNALIERGVDPSNFTQQTPTQQRTQASGTDAQQVVELQRQIALMNQQLPLIIADVAQVNHQIVKEGWDVDPATVLQYSIQRGVRATDALHQLTADQRQKRDAENLAKQLAAAREEGKRELMAAHPTSDYGRGAPRMGIGDMQKQLAELGDRDKRREAAIAEARQLTAQGIL